MKNTINCRSLFLYLILFCLVAFFYLPVVSEAVVTINVNKKSKIIKEDIALKDIASLNGDNSELINKLRDIYICRAPLPGKIKTISSQHINLRLKQNDIDMDSVLLHMTDLAEAERSSIVVDREKIEKIVKDYVVKNLIHADARVKIKNIQVRQDLTLPEGNIIFQVVPLKEKKLSGIINLTVLFEVNGYYKQEVSARVDIEILSEVVIAKRPLPRNRIISIDDIDFVEMDITELPFNILTSSEDVVGKRTKGTINSKTVLRSDLLELPPVVRRGDVVTIIAESGCLKISARGKIKKDGHVGEVLKVENLDSKKAIYAKVVDSETVTVDF
jgi:flagella basal body P-ring formation protein FlgA